MKGLLTTILSLIIISSGFGQSVCIVTDDYTPVLEDGKKTITVCPGTTVMLKSVECSDNSTPVKANWYKEGDAIAPLFTYPVSDPGTYVAQYMSPDGLSRDTIVLKNKTVVTPKIFENGAEKMVHMTCENVPIKLTGTEDVDFSNYRWYDAANPTETLSNTSELTFDRDLNPGENTRNLDITYEVTYKDCKVNTSKPVVFKAMPKFTLGPDTGFCPERTHLVTLPDSIKNNSNYTYSWESGKTTPYLSVQTPGDYSLRIYDNVLQCENFDTISIQEYSQPEITVSQDTTICAGSLVNLKVSVLIGTGTSPFFYEWNPAETINDHLVSEITAKPNHANTQYKVRVLDKNYCYALDSVQVDWHPEIQASVTFSDTSTCKEPVTLEALGSGGTPFTSGSPYQYSWSPQTNMTGGNTSTPVVIPEDTIVYTVTVSDALGCTEDTTVTVKTPDIAVKIQEGTSLTVCENETVSLNAEVFGGEAGFNFSWEGTGLSGETSSDRIASTSANPAPGENNYSIKATDIRGCEATDSITVSTVTPPEVIVGNSSYNICEGDSIRFDTPTVTGGTGNYLINWSGENLSDASTVTPLYKSLNQSGTKEFVVEIKDIDVSCPEAYDTVQVKLIPAPYSVLVSTDTAICEGSTAYLIPDTLDGGGLRFEWRKAGETTVLSDTNAFPAVESVKYHLTTFEPVIGCRSEDSIQVSYIPAPALPEIQADTVAPNYEPYNLASITKDPDLNYLWTTNATGSFGTPSSSSTLYNPTTGNIGHFSFSLEVENQCGQSNSATHTVRFYEEVIKLVNKLPYVPNVFSPSALSRENKSLMVFSENLSEQDFNLSIFNRWGELVYETKNMTDAVNEGWNGDHIKTGQPSMAGVYTYTLKGRFKDGEAFQKTGTVTLIK